MPLTRRLGWRRGELRHFLQAALLRPVPRDHRESDAAFRRRRVITTVTLLVGAVLLGIGINLPPGDPRFLWATTALAGVWTVGALLSGRLHMGRAWTRGGDHARPVVQSLALGLLAVAIFCGGAVLVAQVPFLRTSVEQVLDHARYASLPVVAVITLLNGLAEELFFRGAVFAAIGARHAVLISTGLYALVTTATGNVMLVFAAVLLGLLVGMQRRVTGGVLGPMITHTTWSMSMLLLLPPLLTALT